MQVQTTFCLGVLRICSQQSTLLQRARGQNRQQLENGSNLTFLNHLTLYRSHATLLFQTPRFIYRSRLAISRISHVPLIMFLTLEKLSSASANSHLALRSSPSHIMDVHLPSWYQELQSQGRRANIRLRKERLCSDQRRSWIMSSRLRLWLENRVRWEIQ